MTREQFLKEISDWYRPETLRDFFTQIIAPDAVVYGCYEALRHQQTDGSYFARYYICTHSRLMVLKVSGADLRMSVYQLSELQKVGAKVPAAPRGQLEWARGEWIFRFGHGQENVRPVYPDKESQVGGYRAVLRRLLSY